MKWGIWLSERMQQIGEKNKHNESWNITMRDIQLDDWVLFVSYIPVVCQSIDVSTGMKRRDGQK